MQQQHSAQTVIAATISARLYQARSDASRLSLAAKNLSIIANRIGLGAASLRTLSDFYDEFAKKSIKLSEHITELSTSIAQLAVKAWRQNQLLSCVDSVLHQHPEHLFLQRCFASHSTTVQHTELQSQQYSQQLQQSLEDLAQYLQTIKVIAVNSRIESASLLAYTVQLGDLTKTIEKYTQSMMAHVEYSQRQLREFI